MTFYSSVNGDSGMIVDKSIKQELCMCRKCLSKVMDKTISSYFSFRYANQSDGSL